MTEVNREIAIILKVFFNFETCVLSFNNLVYFKIASKNKTTVDKIFYTLIKYSIAKKETEVANLL